MRPIQLPAGLEDSNVEIYIHKGELRAIYCGTVVSFNGLPESFRESLTAHMLSDRKAVRSLMNDMGISEPLEMLKKYVSCNFGNFDTIPDVTSDGIIVKECWDCGKRGTCPGEGKVCTRLQCHNEMLTSQETKIFFLIIDGKQDKEIADLTGCTLSTVTTHLRHIREKMGVNNRIEIMGWAMKRKLLF